MEGCGELVAALQKLDDCRLGDHKPKGQLLGGFGEAKIII